MMALVMTPVVTVALFALSLVGSTSVVLEVEPVVFAAPIVSVSGDTLPTWATARWAAAVRTREVAMSDRLTPSLHTGDFDGDGRSDVAVFVKRTAGGKEGILFIHRRAGAEFLVGAGRDFGNGGDSFDWADQWRVESQRGRPDVVVITRSESGGGAISFRAGRYRWVQRGD